jgi:small subunit ribosomal protein S8
MSTNYLLADTLTRIRNGQNARLSKVEAQDSKLIKNVMDALQREGFIRAHREYEKAPGRMMREIELKYHEGEPAIKEIRCMSSPGRREYAKVNEIESFHNGLGINILTTSKGVLSDYEARTQNVGGEVLCQVF